MALREKIEQDIKTAMKAGEKERVSTLRLLKNMLHNKEIEKGRDLEDDEVQSVIQKAVKQRRESIEAYEKADKTEQAEKEASEAEILSDYLPEPLSDEELNELIDQVLEELDEDSPHQGKVIGAVMKKAGNRADGNKVAKQVGQKLNE